MYASFLDYVQGSTQVEADDGPDVSAGKYGQPALIQSSGNPEELKRNIVNVKDLNESKTNMTVWVRGRLHTSRAKGG